ncbi:hypothetical protein BKI52_12440 [marine bacterium AO1-C]|nr:hypothetical protein BKI52_12440 [marine bacterium AO1-C]
MISLPEKDYTIHLSADSFIKALQGDKFVIDEQGNKHNFFYTKYRIDKAEYRNVVVIDQRVIVSEPIIIKEDELFGEALAFKYPILIQGGEFQDSFSISGGEFQGLFRISWGEFQQLFHISGGEFQQSFHIERGKFQNGFRIEGGEFQNGFYIERGEFKQWFRISGGEFQQLFHISGGEFQQLFRIEGGRFKDSFSIEGGEFLQWFSIEGGEFTKEFIVDNFPSKRGIRNLEISTSKLIKSKFTINENAKIQQLTFKKGISGSGALYIESIHLQTLNFENFINEGKLEITGLKLGKFQTKIINQESIPEVAIKREPPISWFETQIIISKSNLGSAVFKGVLFEAFDRVIIDDSKLNNISTVNKHFPLSAENLGNKVNDQGILEHDPEQMAEIYNQLYLAMQKQGNRLKEMEYYSQYLYWQRKAAKEDKKWPALISLTLYQWSTNFGQSWVRGLGISLLVGLIFYFFYSISLNGVQVGFQYFTFDNLLFHGKQFFQFLLPTHKLDFIPHTQSRFLSSFLDIFSRIALGYMYYQTITAFRRFGRK